MNAQMDSNTYQNNNLESCLQVTVSSMYCTKNAITTLAWIPFLLPNQQHQSTEENKQH